MTGTFPANVQAGIKTVSGTNGPPSTAQDAPAAAAGAGGAQGDYAVTYTAQTDTPGNKNHGQERQTPVPYEFSINRENFPPYTQTNDYDDSVVDKQPCGKSCVSGE
ncbi:MAG: hypothetical protein LQ338_000313 [Usnochroma carphineum]|nr:MAG: hypothetical protein LQ338_000313 [Usnochroma carphineum]